MSFSVLTLIHFSSSFPLEAAEFFVADLLQVARVDVTSAEGTHLLLVQQLLEVVDVGGELALGTEAALVGDDVSKGR